MKLKDERVKITNEVLSGMKVSLISACSETKCYTVPTGKNTFTKVDIYNKLLVMYNITFEGFKTVRMGALVSREDKWNSGGRAGLPKNC